MMAETMQTNSQVRMANDQITLIKNIEAKESIPNEQLNEALKKTDT
jgi:hypothetical protein